MTRALQDLAFSEYLFNKFSVSFQVHTRDAWMQSFQLFNGIHRIRIMLYISKPW